MTASGDAAQRALNRAEIVEVLLRFEEGARRGDPETLCSVFTDDAELDYEGKHIAGHKEIRAYFGAYSTGAGASAKTASAFESGTSRPFLGNVDITFEGDVARCESSTLATHAGLRDGATVVLLRVVADDDEFVRTPSGWQIRRRVHRRLWGFEVPGALGTATPPPANSPR